MIQRYEVGDAHSGSSMIPHKYGDYVLYADHESEVAALRAECDELASYRAWTMDRANEALREIGCASEQVENLSGDAYALLRTALLRQSSYINTLRANVDRLRSGIAALRSLLRTAYEEAQEVQL